MNRSSLTALLTVRWLLLHLLFVAAAIATGFLAWWQWDRAHAAGGSFKNLGYALQWPMFGAFTLFLWYRVARMHIHEMRGSGGGDAPASDAQSADAHSSDAQSGEGGAGRAGVGSIEPGALGESNGRRLVPPPAEPVDSEEDPQMAEYNRLLAELNSADAGSADQAGADTGTERTGADQEADQTGTERARSA